MNLLRAARFRRAGWVLALLLAALALIAHSLVFNFVTDDAFISFVYSRNLAEHGQLVFNLGERRSRATPTSCGPCCWPAS